MSKIQIRKPIEIKIATVVAVAIILRESDLTVLDSAMREITGGEIDYFDNEFAVVDVGLLHPADQAMDWDALIALFKSYRLNPVAVRNASPEMEQGILAHGLSLDASAKPRHETAAEMPEAADAVIAPAAMETATAATIAPPVAKPGSMIVDTPVRAGQRIYAQGCDLIVTAAVNNGAEVIADGSIHVYAPLRGRALAGASGDAGARIFALSMEAELVSIAGMYRTFDEGLPKNLFQQAVQVSLDGDRIDLHSISSTFF
ncbi:MAG: septum site-determining protein MinC [Burkholderiales bacterium]